MSRVSSLCNGLTGIMAVLYGEGDYMKTVGIATSGGYDCDNQAATCGGLIGVLQGAGGIPAELSRNFGIWKWDKPFNDLYINYSRDDLPNATPISDIVARIDAIAKTAILENGGRIEVRSGDAPDIAGKTLSTQYYGNELTWVFGEGGKATVSGGAFGEDAKASYEQDGQRVRIKVGEWTSQGYYNGENLALGAKKTGGEVTYVVNCDF